MSGSMSKGESSLEDLIPVVSKIQDIVLTSTSCGSLDLPQVVVVGAQSSGKSSVIELLVRRDFLPRGTGIVTRRPLAISLINDSSEFCEFLHVKNRKYYDFEEVRGEIETETLRIAGGNKGISAVPISLKIHSPHVLDLTVVDLPGVTKVPVGDQPADIEKQTKDLVMEYISNPNSIILAVTPANQDLVNSESLKMARSVDPLGKRTLGVLTKLDLMDKGTNALDMLNGTTYPLKLGFIGIVNRSQQDIQDRKSLEDSFVAEKEYFQNHPAYRSIAHKCGTAYLGKTLNHILMTHIRERLPDIKARLTTLIGQTEQELSRFGQGQVPVTREQQGPLILTLMMKFATAFVGSIDGMPVSSDLNAMKELGGGAQIYRVFSEVFEKKLKDIDPLGQLSYSDVRTAIRNSAGPRASLFVPELAFDMLIKPLIKLLEAPSQQCVELVYEELMKICHGCGSVELQRFPKLEANLIDTLSKLLNERLGPTSAYVSSLIEIQKAYINTNHAHFISASDAMTSILGVGQHQGQGFLNVNHGTLEKLHIRSNPVGDSLEKSSFESGENDSDISSGDDVDPGISCKAHGETSAANFGTPAQREIFLSYFFGKGPNSHSASSLISHELAQRPRGASTSQSDNRESAFRNPSSQLISSDITPESRVIKGVSQDLSAQAQLRAERLKKEALDLGPKERLECDLMFKLIDSYFTIVRETITDQVPKAIMHFLVNFTKSSAQNRLVSDLYKEAMFDELLFEDEAVAQERKKLIEALSTYRAAARVITEVV